MESFSDPQAALAALEWQIELGATDAICDAPVDRYALQPPVSAPERPAAAPARAVPQTVAAGSGDTPVVSGPDPVEVATDAAARASDLDELRAAVTAYEHCALKKGARRTVFADGVPSARVMIVGEAPGRDEDRAGRPFVGRAGQLLDRMLAAIGLSRSENVYITNVLPWRPPQNRDPRPDEIAMLKPFLARHIALVQPEIQVVMGNISCQALLGRRGITRLRGQWTEAADLPALPMFHPAYLLRTPSAKRETWADLLSLKARLGGPR